MIYQAKQVKTNADTQLPMHWLYVFRINMSLRSTKEDLNYLYHVIVENRLKMQLTYIFMFPQTISVRTGWSKLKSIFQMLDFLQNSRSKFWTT